jgi:hypothetical protein
MVLVARLAQARANRPGRAAPAAGGVDAARGRSRRRAADAQDAAGGIATSAISSRPLAGSITRPRWIIFMVLESNQPIARVEHASKLLFC